ncbi:sugar ABC transporter substrate-binding protein [Paenibacillus sp. HB172176]|uniref:ABC transporter substrate-binding protein n=1 Tax=Paenibacillus sp. HB172176 TaxID=2493690 RepID=UPI001438BDCE|nr:sugar ABC transporter substrate-binding protein [Paenibacillus sp. HB172176]
MKRSIGIILMAALVLMLAACGNNNADNKGSNSGNGGASNNPSPSASSKPAEKTTISYWTDDRHDQEYIKELIADFNANNPDNIEVELTVLSENYNQSVDIAFSGNQAPDLLRLKSANTGTFVKKGYLAPIDSYMTDELNEKFSTMIIDGVNKFDGKLYSLPNTGLTLRLVYNQDLFDKAGIAAPPQSLEEMVADAKKITEVGKKDGVYGFALNFKNPKSAFDRSVREILSLSGHQGLGFDINTGKFDFAPYSQVVDYYKQMWDDGSVLPGAESLDIDPLRAQFAAGKIGMYLCFSTEPGVYQDQFPTEINWGGALPPTIDGQRGGTSEIVSAGTWMGISATSEHKDAAWKFMEYMQGDEIMTTYHEKGFGIAIVPSIAEKAKQPDVKGMEGFLVGKFDSMWPVSPTVTPEGLNYGDAFFKYMIEGGDLNKIVADLNTRYNDALDKAIEKGDVTVTPDPDFDPKKLQG